jgi:outer membrane protein assembly factor BamB
MHGQWASPAYAAEPVPQVIFPGGDGWLRAFDPPTGTLLWKFDCNPKDATYNIGGFGRKCHFIAAPAISNHRLYIGTGQDPEHFEGPADLWCIDLKKAVENGKTCPDRDVSPDLITTRIKPLGGEEKILTKANSGSAAVWNYSGTEKRKFAPRDFKFGRTISTMCIVDDILYAAELGGLLHCLDAITGKHFWQYDLKSAIWASPYFVDGKIILPSEGGDLFIFRHEKTHEVFDEIGVAALEKTPKFANAAMKKMRTEIEKKYLIAKIEMDAPIRGTPSVAGGVLYLATEKTLYAFGKP